MAGPYTGRGAYIGAGVESTYGTAVTITNWLPVISSSIVRTQVRQWKPHLGINGGATATRRSMYTERETVAGDVEAVVSFDDSSVLFASHALGAVSSSGSGPYAHTCTLGALPVGLTLEQALGEDEDGADRSETFEGCKITRSGWSLAAGGLMTQRHTIIGETGAARGAAGAPTLATAAEPIDSSMAGTLAFNGRTYILTSMDLTLDNKLAERLKTGSKNTLEPQIGDFREVELACSVEYLDDNPHIDHHASSGSDAVITLTGSGNHTLVITVHNAETVSETTTAGGPGITETSFVLKGMSDGTDLGLSMVFNNDNALATANA